MIYKLAKKQLKKCNLISIDLVKAKNFKEIINILSDKQSITNRDRYIYGYALIQTKQYLQGLVTLWPLAVNGSTNLQADCMDIAYYIFKNENLLITLEDLSEKTLYTLFQIAQSLIPQNEGAVNLKQHLLDFLWRKKDYEQLGRILKLQKKEQSGSLLENLSKLCFFQANSKLLSNIAGFVGNILTGGACLILRNSIYHHDIPDEINLLANELKHIFNKFSMNHQQKLSWDKALFESFVDYEASILIKVLQLAITHEKTDLEIIPTPSYLITYDATHQFGKNFLPWLASVSQELYEMYDANTYQVIIWALDGNKLFNVNNILKPKIKKYFHPNLRLALMFRAASVKKSFLNDLVETKDFENLESIDLFRTIAVQTVNSIIKSSKNITNEFWQMLYQFYPMLQDPEINNALIKKTIDVLSDEHKEQKNLNLSVIRNIAHQIKNYELARQFDALFDRQQECLNFLLLIKKNSKQIIKNIKDQLSLITHLVMIADCCFLVAGELSEEFFKYIADLFDDKKINKLIKLRDYFGLYYALNEFQTFSFKDVICNLVKQLNLSVASIPNCKNFQQITKEPLKASVLALQDPFAILDVGITDPKQTIMQKVMKSIQQAPDKMAIFRQAQSELFDPAKRFLHHYFRYLSHDDQKTLSDYTFVPLQNFPFDIPFRSEFLNDN